MLPSEDYFQGTHTTISILLLNLFYGLRFSIDSNHNSKHIFTAYLKSKLDQHGPPHLLLLCHWCYILHFPWHIDTISRLCICSCYSFCLSYISIDQNPSWSSKAKLNLFSFVQSSTKLSISSNPCLLLDMIILFPLFSLSLCLIKALTKLRLLCG